MRTAKEGKKIRWSVEALSICRLNHTVPSVVSISFLSALNCAKVESPLSHIIPLYEHALSDLDKNASKEGTKR